MHELFNADCSDALKNFPENSFDAIVTDPPYGLGSKDPSAEDIEAYLNEGVSPTQKDFMGMGWQIPTVGIWKECFRVLKPGRHLCFFAATRTWDIMLAGALKAGFISDGSLSQPFGSDILAWVYSSGFPKSLNIEAQVKKLGGDSDKWKGYGTALKPSFEPIVCLRKPGPSVEGLTPLEAPFFYGAKASKSEKSDGLEANGNSHPTVKPIHLMEWLVEATTRPQESILDPFCGSGSTGVASILRGRRFVGVERDPKFYKIANTRLTVAEADTDVESKNLFELAMGGEF
jgi:DNA modification methylase